MNIIVKEELKAYIDPLTPDEHDALERSILAEGCRDALVLWGDVLVDGHNRYGICQKHGLPFQTIQHPHFKSMEDVHLWMIDQHLGRRSVSDFQRGVLALRKKEILTERRQRRMAESAEQLAAAPGEAGAAEPAADAPWEGAAELPPVPALNTREAVARAARLSASQVQQIEKIQKSAAPELVAAVRSGEVSLNTAATVAALPVEEQQAVVAAGKDEIKQAAKRVRQSKAKPKEAGEGGEEKLNSAGLPPVTAESATEAQIKALQARVAELETENAALRAQLAALQG
ncbi:plasmid replication/partition related protein [Pelomonas sp. APW6]|uniref:Plasmid replication/partition related protein n=1 Tax=Roseateles subflavus TaxID=3053353 RepID=A0ABT7LD83_9BURK|nr:plasmid replication/partition related protein [Pelomonas sp. APW6]MDL5030831.1 plasmid replication/partition related protein [Pelomonas sp. APW6]